MALTAADALKAHIESLGLGLTAQRPTRGGSRSEPRPAPNRRLPFVVIDDVLPIVLGPMQDGGAGPATEELQVELWMAYRWKPEGVGQPAENASLRDDLIRGLEGARLEPIGTSVVYVCRVRDVTPLPEPEHNIARYVLTVAVIRRL